MKRRSNVSVVFGTGLAIIINHSNDYEEHFYVPVYISLA